MDRLLIAVVVAAWAGNFLFSKLAMRELPPLMFTALRLLMLGVVLLPWIKAPPKSQRVRLALVAVLYGAVHFGLGFMGLQRSPTIGSPMIVMQSYVPMATILAWLIYRESLSRRDVLALIVSFSGIAVLGFDPAIFAAPFAMWLLVASAFFLALGSVMLRRLTGVDVATQQGWTAWIGLLPLLAWSMLTEPGAITAVRNASAMAWVGVIYAAIVVSLVGHGAYYFLLQRRPVAEVTPYLLLAPVLTTLLGVWVLGDPVTMRLIAGGALVLAGVAMKRR